MKKLILNEDTFIPKYRQIKEHFKARIISGELKVGDLLPSDTELCSALNLSSNTVRLAFKELLEEGLIIREQGRGTYVADKIRLKKQIVVVLPVRGIGPFYGRILEGIEYEARSQGYNVFVKMVIKLGVPEGVVIDELIKGRESGILWCVSDIKALREMTPSIQASGVPLALVANYLDTPGHDSIEIDMYDHAYRLADKMICAGCRDIALLLLPHRDTSDATARQIEGVHDAHKLHSIPWEDKVIRVERSAHQSLDDLFETVYMHLIRYKGRFDGMIVPSLTVDAKTCLAHLWKKDQVLFSGLRAGIVISDADYQGGILPMPVITIKRQDFELGKAAAARIIARIERRAQGGPTTIMIKALAENKCRTG
ncbi:MAG: GntR family transcriptional regulator [Kiritimatiellia bacterium]